MMKKTLVVLGILAVASAAHGVSLTMLPETLSGINNSNALGGYHVQGMTDDGAYVVGTQPLAGGPYNGADGVLIVKVSDLSTTVLRPKAGMAGRGIAISQTGTLIPAGVIGSNGALGRGWDNLGNYYLNTAVGVASESQVAEQNAVSIDPATGNGWLVGTRSANKGNEALAWKYVGGVFTSLNATWGKAGSGKTVLNGVSNGGIAVGTDKGFGGSDRAIWADVANNGNVTAIPLHANATGRGQGNAASPNGLYLGGQMYVTTGDLLHGFRYEMGGATVELLPAGGDDARAQQSNAFDIASDGTAVGFTYNPTDANGNQLAGYRATIWSGTDTNGQLLDDVLQNLGVDMSAWAYLERAISVTPDGLTIAGRGVLASDGSYRGFVATIPEPATMLFLALGGLALLRRRR